MTAISPSAVLSALATAIDEDPARWPRRGEAVPADVAGYRDDRYAYVLSATWQAIGPDSGALAVMHDRGDLHVPASWRKKGQWNAPAPDWTGKGAAYKVRLSAITSPAPDPVPANSSSAIAGPVATAPGNSVAVMWDPPSEPRAERDAPDLCPDCDGPVRMDARGITRWCPDCNIIRVPPGVLAPYDRGPASTTRQARSQRERDDDDKRTAVAAGEFMRRIEALAANPKIHPHSADILTWYAEVVESARKARDGQRLAELAVEFDDDVKSGEIRRHRWWQGEIDAGTDDGLDDDGLDDEDWDGADDDAPGTAVVLATPASIAAQQYRAQPEPMGWAEAIAELGWRIAPVSGWDGCVIIDCGVRCTTRETMHHVGGSNPMAGGFACNWHHSQLTQLIYNTNRARGIQ